MTISGDSDSHGLARRTSIHLTPDPTRVVARLFVAGQEDYGSKQSRTSLVVDRVLALSEDDVRRALEDVTARFGDRHNDLPYWLDLHAHRVASRVEPGAHLTEERWKLIGAFFTHEFSVEGAALCNPSIVLHPDQSNLAHGNVRFIMSVRGVGEGHRSSIGFRTGEITASGDVCLHTAHSHLVTGFRTDSYLRQMAFFGLLQAVDDFGENAKFVLDQLPEEFTVSELEEQLTRLLHDRDTYRDAEATVHHFRAIAERSYAVSFPPETDVSERILWPHASAEWRGMEDARFVQFHQKNASIDHPDYFATYTAFDGTNISQQLLHTHDFETFTTYPMAGAAARGKGMALFPRKVGGQYVALSRADHESNSIAYSDHIEYWSRSHLLQTPARPWEIIQLGNCGSPIETEAGWLVLTHGVGAMRTYHISALLLDKDDPMRIIGSLDEPLLSPSEAERDGYVPNVVYSCGSLLHEKHLVLPFGIADNSIGVATANIDDVLNRLTA